jgi:hypothetical protein
LRSKGYHVNPLLLFFCTFLKKGGEDNWQRLI